MFVTADCFVLVVVFCFPPQTPVLLHTVCRTEQPHCTQQSREGGGARAGHDVVTSGSGNCLRLGTREEDGGYQELVRAPARDGTWIGQELKARPRRPPHMP